VPDDPHVLGWWQGSARPGSRQGSVVIDGHVDTAAHGPGALFSLRQLHPGDPLVLSTNHGSSHYLIVAVRSYPKATLPAEVFTSTGPPRLVIITCGGAFDPTTRQYADNIIAYALPAPTDLPGHS
jgi:sortase (surface protein transpeptidase)